MAQMLSHLPCKAGIKRSILGFSHLWMKQDGLGSFNRNSTIHHAQKFVGLKMMVISKSASLYNNARLLLVNVTYIYQEPNVGSSILIMTNGLAHNYHLRESFYF